MYEKLVQSGDLIEIYTYEKEPSPKRFMVRKRKRTKRAQYRLARHVNRARQAFRRKVRATLALGNPHMLTLTEVSNCSIKLAYAHFTRMGLNLRRLYGPSIAWIAVPEFQKRGAVHFHALIWGIPHEAYLGERYSRNIQSCWARGWLDILATDGSPKIASYMAKYMSKEMLDARLAGQKSYTASRNCMRSVSLNTGTAIETVKEDFGIKDDGTSEHLTLMVEREYNTAWLGRANYKAFVKRVL